MKNILAFLLINSIAITSVYCECCRSLDIQRNSDLYLLDSEAFCTYVTSYKRSRLEHVCLDGTVHTSAYCGVGSCNIFGCNCDGGCRDRGRFYNMTLCHEIIRKREAVTKLIINDFDDYHGLGECGLPENCHKMYSCEEAKKKYDLAIQVCSSIEPFFGVASLVTGGLSQLITTGLGTLCTSKALASYKMQVDLCNLKNVL